MKEELAHLKQKREHEDRDNRMKYGKRYKEIVKSKEDEKKKSTRSAKGIRALHKGKWGYMKDRKFTPDIYRVDLTLIAMLSFLLPLAYKVVDAAVAKIPDDEELGEKLIEICLLIVGKAVKLTKTTADDELFEKVKLLWQPETKTKRDRSKRDGLTFYK